MCDMLKNRETAAKSTVLILDSQIGTAAAALMAVRILIDHGVPEDHIIMVVVLLSRAGGIHHLCKAFPKLKILTAAVDDQLKELWIPNSDHDGAWRARQEEQLSTDDEEDEEAVKVEEEGQQLQRDDRQGPRSRSGSLRRPESADARGKKGVCDCCSLIRGMKAHRKLE